MFLRTGESISSKITGLKQYSADLIQGGLEIPCRLTLSRSTKKLAEKAKKLFELWEQMTSKSETTKAASLVASESKELDFLNNAQLTSAVNGNLAKKIKLEDTLTSMGDVPHDWWLYHELGKVRHTKEDKNAISRRNDKHISFTQNMLNFLR